MSEPSDQAESEIHSEITTKEVPDEIVPVREPVKTTHVEKVEIKSYVAIFKANPLYPEASRVVHWRDPVKSGLLFGIFNFFYLLITYGEYSFLTLVSYLLMTLLGVSLAYVNYVVMRASWFQGKKVDNPLKEKFKGSNFHVSKTTVEQHLQTIIDLTNTTVDKFRDVFFISNTVESIKVLGYLYLIAVLGKWFNDSTLLYLVVLGFFVWPRLYEEKQKEIDQFYGIAKTEVKKYYQIALSKVPPQVQQKLAFLKEKAQ